MLRIDLMLILCLLGLTLCSGCSPEEKSLEKYANTTLTAGTGLDDLLLGETTLDWFVKNVGKGRFSLAVSDESAFDFNFNNEQIAFQFLITGSCDKQISVTRDMRSATTDLEAYLVKHPGCRDLTLSSISVAKGSWLSGTFFKGASEQGVKLGAPITAAFNHGEIKNSLPRMVAGLSPNNSENVIEYRGISFHYDASSTGNMEDTVINRITIFSAEE